MAFFLHNFQVRQTGVRLLAGEAGGRSTIHEDADQRFTIVNPGALRIVICAGDRDGFTTPAPAPRIPQPHDPILTKPTHQDVRLRLRSGRVLEMWFRLWLRGIYQMETPLAYMRPVAYICEGKERGRGSAGRSGCSDSEKRTE